MNFRPSINTKSSTASLDAVGNTTTSSLNGYDKYLEKQRRAQQQKTELQIKEKKVFRDGTNWQPKVTNPKMPNLSTTNMKHKKVEPQQPLRTTTKLISSSDDSRKSLQAQ